MARSGTPLVEMRSICKRFGGVQAVDDVTVDLYPGEVVGVLGHNGAGKSTLIKMLAGAYPADSGEIYINGEKVEIATPRDARRHGIETIYRSEEHTSELQSLMRISYAVFCLKKKKKKSRHNTTTKNDTENTNNNQ